MSAPRTTPCKTCGGTGIEHVCGWVCVDIECRDCRTERRLQREHQLDHDEDRAFGGHW